MNYEPKRTVTLSNTNNPKEDGPSVDVKIQTSVGWLDKRIFFYKYVVNGPGITDAEDAFKELKMDYATSRRLLVDGKLIMENDLPNEPPCSWLYFEDIKVPIKLCRNKTELDYGAGYDAGYLDGKNYGEHVASVLKVTEGK